MFSLIIKSIDVDNSEFTTNTGDVYPLLFGIHSDITVDELQKVVDESIDIILKIVNDEK